VTKRIAYLREKIFSTEPEICSERAELITQAYKETEGMPMILRRAIALDRILSNMSIYILPGELIVGNQASKDRSAPIFPEYGIGWIKDGLEEFSKRKVDKFLVSGETKEKLKRIFPYWKGKTNYDFNMKLMDSILPEKIAKTYDKINAKFNEVLGNSGRVSTGNGHIIANYKRVINRGLNSIIKVAEDELRKVEYTAKYEDLEKKLFLKSTTIACKAVIKFAKRYAELAKNLAEKEKDTRRKMELEKISEICNWVPENTARNLWEALQSYWFIHLIIQIEDNGHSISLGRFDQYLYPYYKKDIETKALTREEAKELVESFYLKCNQINKVRNWAHTMIMHGYPLFQTLVLGGQTQDGEDAVNEFTYLCLEANAEAKLPQPTVVVRIHSESSDEYLVKCVESLRQHGGGLPGFFSDEVAIPLLTSIGISLEDARDWAVVGCCEPTIPGKTNPITGGTCHINLLKILELALNNGVNPNNGLQLCSGDGDLTTFNSFEEVFQAYKKQLNYYLSFIPLFDYVTAKTHAEMTPTPFLSSLIDYRISPLGKDVSRGGGPTYNHTLINGYGTPNVGNSLAALKKLVFEEKVLSRAELKEACENNFEGQRGEEVRQILLNKAPKYGNDDDYVDLLTRDASNLFLKGMRKYVPPYGGVYGPSPQTLSANVIMGSVVGATPDGRKAGEPVADNISPTPGTDVNGPSATLNSVAKLDHVNAINGVILNLKFHPSALDGDEQIRKFAKLIYTYMVDKKGFQVQINIVSADALREARKNPDKYRNLVVKVAGYSAFFVTLDRVLQDQIIARTEHIFAGAVSSK